MSFESSRIITSPRSSFGLVAMTFSIFSCVLSGTPLLYVRASSGAVFGYVAVKVTDSRTNIVVSDSDASFKLKDFSVFFDQAPLVSTSSKSSGKTLCKTSISSFCCSSYGDCVTVAESLSRTNWLGRLFLG